MFTLFLCGQIWFSVPRSWVSYPLNAPSSSCLPWPLLQVQAEIKRKWRRWMLQRFLGAGAKYQQPSIGSNGNNFSTQITMTIKCSPSTRRASECREHLSAIWGEAASLFVSLLSFIGGQFFCLYVCLWSVDEVMWRLFCSVCTETNKWALSTSSLASHSRIPQGGAKPDHLLCVFKGNTAWPRFWGIDKYSQCPRGVL